MPNQNPQTSKHSKDEVCPCCGPTEFEFPEELMTPEIKKMKESMSPEEFEKWIASMW